MSFQWSNFDELEMFCSDVSAITWTSKVCRQWTEVADFFSADRFWKVVEKLAQ